MSSRIWHFLFLGIVALIFFSSSLFVLVALINKPQEAPIELISLDYTTMSVCPGDVVPYSIRWSIRRPAIMELSSTTKRGHTGTGDTIITGRMADTRIVNNNKKTEIIDTDPSFTIPELPPGDYARILSVGTRSEDSEPIFVSFPYTIPDGCE